MGDLRNKMWKLERDRRTRELQARLLPPARPPVIALCQCGNSDKETNLFACTGRRRSDPTMIYCRHCAPPDIRALCWPTG